MVSIRPGDQPMPAEWETHELRFRSKDVVGAVHLKSERDADDGIIIEVEQRSLRRIGQAEMLESTSQRILHDSDGQIRRTQSLWRTGPIERQQVAMVTGDAMEFEDSVEPNSRKTRRSIPDFVAGPMYVYQSLLREPMTVGQRRETDVAIPAIAQISNMQMECTGDAGAVGLIPTAEPLRELRVQTRINDQSPRIMFHWFDSQGYVHKTNVAGQIESNYRCTPQQYQSLGESILSLEQPITLEVPGKTIPSEPLRQVGYELRIPAGLIPLETVDDTEESSEMEPRLSPVEKWMQTLVAPRQYAQRVNDQLFRVIVSADEVSESKLAGKFISFEDQPNEQDLARNRLVDSNSRSVVRLSNLSIAGSDLRTTDTALALTQTVHSVLTHQPLTQGFRKASRVAESSIANSTEQAILLMAMLRARSIPCRMVLGVRHRPEPIGDEDSARTRFRSDDDQPKLNRLGFHAWVIAHADGKWLSLDPVTGGRADAGCLMLAQSDLANASSETILADYLQRLANTRLKVFAAVIR
ncbi:MAG: transglutaminase-like domain-containing protein [Planctomycetota bacterium]